MTTLNDRFDETAVIDALLRQRLIQGDRSLAEQFAAKGKKVAFSPGQVLIQEGAWDDELHFILAGEFDVFIKGVRKATRTPGEHVGEFAGLDAARARTATL